MPRQASRISQRHEPGADPPVPARAAAARLAGLRPRPLADPLAGRTRLRTRVQQADWTWPRRGDWMVQLEEAVLADPRPVLLAAHSLGCHLVAAWAAHSRHADRVRAACWWHRPTSTATTCRPSSPPGAPCRASRCPSRHRRPQRRRPVRQRRRVARWPQTGRRRPGRWGPRPSQRRVGPGRLARGPAAPAPLVPCAMSLKPPWLHAVGLGWQPRGAWSFSQWQGALALRAGLAIALLYVVLVLPHLGVRVDRPPDPALRTIHWRHEQGRHHAFAGVPLQVRTMAATWVAARRPAARMLGTATARRRAGRPPRRPLATRRRRHAVAARGHRGRRAGACTRPAGPAHRAPAPLPRARGAVPAAERRRRSQPTERASWTIADGHQETERPGPGPGSPAGPQGQRRAHGRRQRTQHAQARTAAGRQVPAAHAHGRGLAVRAGREHQEPGHHAAHPGAAGGRGATRSSPANAASAPRAWPAWARCRCWCARCPTKPPR
jgi:hypothetical protein